MGLCEFPCIFSDWQLSSRYNEAKGTMKYNGVVVGVVVIGYKKNLSRSSVRPSVCLLSVGVCVLVK